MPANKENKYAAKTDSPPKLRKLALYAHIESRMAKQVAATEQPYRLNAEVTSSSTAANTKDLSNQAGSDCGQNVSDHNQSSNRPDLSISVEQSDDDLGTELFKNLQIISNVESSSTDDEPEADTLEARSDYVEMQIAETSDSSSMDSTASKLVADHINYNNIFDDLSKLADIEQHLQLLYRPFTYEIDANSKLPLNELCVLVADSIYEPDNYPALIVRIRCPCALVKIFSTGKIISKGLTMDTTRIAALKVIQILEQLGYKLNIKYFIHNIVNASFCMPFKIDLNKLCRKHANHVYFNFDTRPFVTYTMRDTRMRFAIFPNGFVLVMHSRMHSETREAIAEILPILKQFEDGYLTAAEKTKIICGDVTNQLLWEHKLEEDISGFLLYS